MGKRTLKSVLYADDISLMVKGSTETKKTSIDELLLILESFAKKSGLKINVNKTEIISRPGDDINQRFPQFKSAVDATLLGFKVGTDAANKNWNLLIEKLKTKVQLYKRFNLNKFEKVQAWNTNIFPKVTFILRMIPYKPERKEEVDLIRREFLWGGIETLHK